MTRCPAAAAAVTLLRACGAGMQAYVAGVARTRGRTPQVAE